MSLTQAVKKLTISKIKSEPRYTLYLMLLQIAGMALVIYSFATDSGFRHVPNPLQANRSMININFSHIPLAIPVGFSFPLFILLGFMLGGNDSINSDFGFVGNRKVSSISNSLCIILYSVWGAVTAVLSAYAVIAVITLIAGEGQILYTPVLDMRMSAMLVDMGYHFTYYLMVGAVAYMFTTMVSRSIWLVVLIPIIYVVFDRYKALGLLSAELSVIEIVSRNLLLAVVALMISFLINLRREVRR